MNKLIAKINRKENNNVIIFSDTQNIEKITPLFGEYPSDFEKVKYDNNHKLEKDEYFYVDLSDEHIKIIKEEYITGLESTVDLNNDGYNSEYAEMKSLYFVAVEKVFFKRITKSNFLKNNGFLSLGSEPKYEKRPENILSFNEQVDVIFIENERVLLFRSYFHAAILFSLLQEFYDEATSEQIDSILKNSIFNIKDDFSNKDVKVQNKKKIAIFLEESDMDLSDIDTIKKIGIHAEKYGMEGLFEDGKFNINHNADFTKAMDVISGLYYEHEITGVKMHAKASRKISYEDKK